jgi:hypothetical protein
LFLVVSFTFVLVSVKSQMLPLSQSHFIGIAPVFGSLSITNKIEFEPASRWKMNSALARGASRGFSVQSGWIFPLGRRFSFVPEVNLLYTNRKGAIHQSYIISEIIRDRKGTLHLSNLSMQNAMAFRWHFGLFLRNYLQLGPYFEVNLHNRSQINGLETEFFEMQYPDGELVLNRLSVPRHYDFEERISMRILDFGGILSVGTQLALPGKDVLQVELRYSRGAWNITSYQGIRQNRLILTLAYTWYHTSSAGDYRIY